MTIDYGKTKSPFGECYIAACGDTLYALTFGGGDFTGELKKKWPEAAFNRNDEKISAIGRRIFENGECMDVALRGTQFQVEVWRALQHIPAGTTVTYADIARTVGRPKAVRAVGSAVGRNDISYVVPCHRVLRTDGQPGGYRWGIDYKKAILEFEAGKKKR